MSDLFDIKKKNEKYYVHARTEMLGYIPRDVKRVLDVGCGEGHFGSAVKEKFLAEVWGVEISDEAGSEAEKVLDRVFIGDIENGGISFKENFFDCIIFNDVLEHLRYPWVVLKNMRKALAEGGYVIASIPNVRHYRVVKNLLLKKSWEYKDAGVLDKTHLRFFTCKSIREMFEMCGYNVVTLEGIKGKKPPWYMTVLNTLFLNSLEDMRYTQFACVARKRQG